MVAIKVAVRVVGTDHPRTAGTHGVLAVYFFGGGQA